ncbi:unnamed protein product, partial [Heterosigma akashiwo]
EEPALAEAPVAVLLNKSDLPNAVDEEEIKRQLDWELTTENNLVECFQSSVVRETGYP